MKKSEGKAIRISVRLDNEAAQKLENAKEKGYTTSQFVIEKIKNSNAINLNSLRNIMISINMIQNKLEFEDDIEVKNSIREELNKICQSLKLVQNPI